MNEIKNSTPQSMGKSQNNHSESAVLDQNNSTQQDNKNIFGGSLGEIKTLAGLIVGLSTASGFLSVFYYCLVKIQWMPIGLSFSEAVGFVFLSLGIGFLGVFFIILPQLNAFMFFLIYKIENKSIIDLFILFCLVVLEILILGIGIYLIWGQWLKIVGYVFFIIIILWLLYELVNKTDDISGYVFIIFNLLAFIGLHIFSSDALIKRLDLARDNVVIQLSEENFKFLKSTYENLDPSCINKDLRVVCNVNILWRGMGTHTLIEVPTTNKDDYIRMEVPNNEIKVMRVM